MLKQYVFSKWQGLGNDFMLIKAEELPENSAELAQKWCARHWGVGADGVIFLLPGLPGSAALTMEIFNADGTVAAMCGNGIRCLAAWAVQQGWAPADEFVIATRAGLKHVSVSSQSGWNVRVDMGIPQIFARESVRLQSGREVPSYLVSMGNLHRVVLGDESCAWGSDLATLDLEAEGVTLAKSSYGECNVEFALRNSAEDLRLRVRERGVGETMACGTGACATVVAASAEEWCPRRALVHLPGGELQIEWLANEKLIMSGPACEVFQGTINVSQ